MGLSLRTLRKVTAAVEIPSGFLTSMLIYRQGAQTRLIKVRRRYKVCDKPNGIASLTALLVQSLSIQLLIYTLSNAPQ